MLGGRGGVLLPVMGMDADRTDACLLPVDMGGLPVFCMPMSCVSMCLDAAVPLMREHVVLVPSVGSDAGGPWRGLLGSAGVRQ